MSFAAIMVSHYFGMGCFTIILCNIKEGLDSSEC